MLWSNHPKKNYSQKVSHNAENNLIRLWTKVRQIMKKCMGHLQSNFVCP